MRRVGIAAVLAVVLATTSSAHTASASPAQAQPAPAGASLDHDTVDPSVLTRLGLNELEPMSATDAAAAATELRSSSMTPGARFAGFNSMQPSRVLDTRTGIGTPARSLGEGASIRLDVRGVGGIPADADAVVLNITAVASTTGGFVTVWPTGDARPDASSLNMTPGQTVPNLVATRIGLDGSVSLYNAFGSVDLLADAVAWTRADDHFHSITPSRILDTRRGQGISHALAAGETADLAIDGVAGLPATGVGVAVLNLTATRPTATTYLSVWPSGQARPNSSNLNALPDQTVPNLVFATVGSNGKISIFNSAGTTDVIADLVGWIPAGAAFLAVNPVRVLDTRTGTGTYGATLDGLNYTRVAGKISQQRIDLSLTNLYAASYAIGAYVFNVTVAEPTAQSYLTTWPAGQAQPNASSLNYAPGQTVANLVVARPGTNGYVSFSNYAGQAHLIVDLVGVVPVQNSLDTPDDSGTPSVHVLYLQGSDSNTADAANKQAQIRNDVTAFDDWMSGETGYRVNLDRKNGQLEVSTWQLANQTQAQLATWLNDPNGTMLLQLLDDGWANPYGRRQLIYLDTTNAPNPDVCGVTTGQFATVFTSSCNVLQLNGTTTSSQVGTSYNTAQVALHELFHSFGAVPTCAPHRYSSSSSHVTDLTDLMYPAIGTDKHVDVGRDDYWHVDTSPCWSITRSGYLRQG
jgi:hypothetical protein